MQRRHFIVNGVSAAVTGVALVTDACSPGNVIVAYCSKQQHQRLPVADAHVERTHGRPNLSAAGRRGRWGRRENREEYNRKTEKRA
jgi:hypothetical protein